MCWAIEAVKRAVELSDKFKKFSKTQSERYITNKRNVKGRWFIQDIENFTKTCMKEEIYQRNCMREKYKNKQLRPFMNGKWGWMIWTGWCKKESLRIYVKLQILHTNN